MPCQQRHHCTHFVPPLRSPKERHYSLAVYVLLRGLTLLVRTGNHASAPPALRALLAPTRLAHGDALLMCACCSQIIYAFIMYPQTLPASYVRFIQKQAAKESYVLKGIQVSVRSSRALATPCRAYCMLQQRKLRTRCPTVLCAPPRPLRRAQYRSHAHTEHHNPKHARRSSHFARPRACRCRRSTRCAARPTRPPMARCPAASSTRARAARGTRSRCSLTISSALCLCTSPCTCCRRSWCTGGGCSASRCQSWGRRRSASRGGLLQRWPSLRCMSTVMVGGGCLAATLCKRGCARAHSHTRDLTHPRMLQLHTGRVSSCPCASAWCLAARARATASWATQGPACSRSAHGKCLEQQLLVLPAPALHLQHRAA